MADDDEIMEPEEELEPEAADALDGPDLDADELDGPDLDAEELDVEEGEEFGGDEEFEDGEETDEDEAAATGPARKSVVAEDEDDDDDMVAPDDVEADLDTILKDRLVATDDDGGNEDDEEPEERGDTADRLQPKRADEQLCSKCFLLVRQNMPVCPVGDDDCPLFAS